MNAPDPIPAIPRTAPSAAGPGAPAPHTPVSRVPMLIGIVAIVALVLIAAYFVVPTWSSESTDDAYVTAHLTTVTAKVAAYVRTLHVDDNKAVKAGELLVELDPRDYAVEVDVAQANLAAARSRRQESDTRI